jgi:hypothetical protein
MKFRTMAVAGCAAVLAAGLTTGTASATEVLPCSTPFTSPPVRIVGSGWAYQYQVLWCAEGGVVTGIEQRVTHEEDGSKCVWVGNAKESLTRVPDDSGGWNTLNMAEFSCQQGDGTDGSFNPWAVVTVWPNGDSRTPSKGIGDEILD